MQLHTIIFIGMSFKKELNNMVIKVRDEIKSTAVITFIQTLKDRMNNLAKDGNRSGGVIFSDHTIYEKLYYLLLDEAIARTKEDLYKWLLTEAVKTNIFEDIIIRLMESRSYIDDDDDKIIDIEREEERGEHRDYIVSFWWKIEY